MTKTFCGKDCSVCIEKGSLSCTGCTDEQKQIQNKDCEIANCCLKKGHGECNTCGFREECTILAKGETMPAERIAQRERDEKRKAEALRKAPVMAKWLKILFGFSCVTIILKLIVEYGFANELATNIFEYAVMGIYSLILLQMAKEEDLYSKACYYGLAAAAIGLITVLVFKNMLENPLVVVITLVGAILGFVGEFCEFMGHASVLKEASEEMSEKWKTLWKWYIGMIAAAVGCIIFILIDTILGTMFTLAVTVALLVVSIMKLVYLYETAEIFQRISDRNSIE